MSELKTQPDPKHMHSEEPRASYGGLSLQLGLKVPRSFALCVSVSVLLMVWGRGLRRRREGLRLKVKGLVFWVCGLQQD